MTEIEPTEQIIQKLEGKTASTDEIEWLKAQIANAQISIGGNVKHAVIILGNGNKVELSSEMMTLLNSDHLLGDLARDLTNDEIAFGIEQLGKLLPDQAPVLEKELEAITRILRVSLKTDLAALSSEARIERVELLARLNKLCLEVTEISFNAISTGVAPPEYNSSSPFRGLESFRPQDAAYFLGRENLTQKLVHKLNEHNFLAVLGASGSGKSSLVMAGLIPTLGLPYAIFRPGAEPLAEMEKALQKNPSLLVVDQFEEIFASSVAQERHQFISNILNVAKNIRVVITLRADFIGEVAPFRSLKDEVQSYQEIIPPMDEAELRHAMEGQAVYARLRFEADLSQQMLEDVGNEPGAMPLLQHALWTLWLRRHGRWLRAQEYRAFGGVRQAIASTAEAIYARCAEWERERLLEIFLRLTRVGEGLDGHDTRRRVLESDLTPTGNDPTVTQTLIQQLVAARLIVVTGNEVEVAHEALIHHWQRLRRWLDDNRDNLRLKQRISEDALHWYSADREESLLIHRGARLEQALTLSKNPRYWLAHREQEYLTACMQLQEREIKSKETRRQRIIVGLITFSIVTLILAGIAFYQMRQAEEQRNLARARELAAQSQSSNLGDGTYMIQSGLLAVEASRYGTGLQADQALRRYLNLAALPVTHMIHNDNISAAIFSPDGRFVASGSEDDTVRVWETFSGREVARMTHDAAVSSIAFSPDGKYVASGSEDHTVRVWDISTELNANTLNRREVARMMHDKAVSSLAFSPDGKYLVSGSFDNTVRVWETLSGREVAHMTHDDAVLSVAFSPDGRYIASGSADNTARVWDISTGLNANTLNRHEVARMTHRNAVSAVAFRRDGKYIVSASWDNTVRMWDALSGREVVRMTHDKSVYSAVFSPDGMYIVSGSADHTARVWGISTGPNEGTFSGREVARMTHDKFVSSVAFSPDGKYVISASWDKTVRVWAISTEPNAGEFNEREIARMTHDDSVSTAAFSPDGRYVVSGSEDNTIRVWEVLSGREVTRITHDKSILSVAFSPDGKYTVFGSEDGTTQVWNISPTLQTGTLAVQMKDDDPINSVAFSPDGKYVVSGREDGIVQVWDVLNRREVVHITHAEPVDSVAFSPDGKYVVSGSFDHTARVWDISTRLKIGTLTGSEVACMMHDEPVNSVAFSPDGKHIVSGSADNTVRVWDISNVCNTDTLTGHKVAYMMHDNDVYSVAFSPDGKYVVSGSADNTVRVWDISTALNTGTYNGREVARMTHNNGVVSVAFSPDGKYIVSGSTDNTVRVWDISAGLNAGVFSGREVVRVTYDGAVPSAAFSPNGRYIISTSRDFTTRIWYWKLEDLMAETCRRLPRNFTRVEWAQFFPDDAYRATCPNLPLETEPTP